MVYTAGFIGALVGDEGKGVREAFYVKKAVMLALRQEALLQLDPKSIDRAKMIFSRHRGTLPYHLEDPLVWTYRYQGGKNAGHITFINGIEHNIHQLPTGILIPRAYNLMAEGVFFEPRSFLKEVRSLRQKGVGISPHNLGIASNAHVTLDYNLELDKEDSAATDGNHTSTGSGIKQTAVDKYGRVGMRMEEFLDPKEFVKALAVRFPTIESRMQLDTFRKVDGDLERFSASYDTERQEIDPLVVLQTNVLTDRLYHYGIAEGAQGFQIDIDRGQYPGITSSSPTVIPTRMDKVVGVVKLYQSSIGGDRPFIGRMPLSLEEVLRGPWIEKGSSTGKPRKIGWLDIVGLRHAIESAQIDCLVSTCGDKLEDLARLGENVKLVVGYKVNGKIYDRWDRSFHKRSTLYQAEPVFEEFPPWGVFFDKERGKLTENAQRYVDRIEELTGLEFASHGHGRDIDEVHEIKDILPAVA